MTVDMTSEHPCTLVCVRKATATLHECHLIYVGIVVVGRHVNLSCYHTTVVISSKTLYAMSAVVPKYQTI
jgi:hypothetical protein